MLLKIFDFLKSFECSVKLFSFLNGKRKQFASDTYFMQISFFIENLIHRRELLRVFGKR